VSEAVGSLDFVSEAAMWAHRSARSLGDAKTGGICQACLSSFGIESIHD